jgi:hypothetical protein
MAAFKEESRGEGYGIWGNPIPNSQFLGRIAGHLPSAGSGYLMGLSAREILA